MFRHLETLWCCGHIDELATGLSLLCTTNMDLAADRAEAAAVGVLIVAN